MIPDWIVYALLGITAYGAGFLYGYRHGQDSVAPALRSLKARLARLGAVLDIMAKQKGGRDE